MKYLLVASLVGVFAQTSFAVTLEQVTRADCTAEGEAYLRMGRNAKILEARFVSLPELSNIADGERMDIEFHTEQESYVGLTSFTVNQEAQVMGTVTLLAEKNEELSNKETMRVVFRDMFGGFVGATLNCELKFN